MGKLIKNHWGRLIIMTAATCTPPQTSGLKEWANQFCRSNRRSVTRFLLAQDILGLPHQKPRWRRKAVPIPTDHQPRPWHRYTRMGMASRPDHEIQSCCVSASQYRSALGGVPGSGIGCGVAVSGDKSSVILYHWHGSLLLGI
jgi:hypothetical protein